MPSTAAKKAMDDLEHKTLPQDIIEAVVGSTEEVVTEKSKQTTLFNVDRETMFARFDHQEIDCGKVLGRGGFCTVFAIESLRNTSASCNKHEKKAASVGKLEEHQTRGFMSKFCKRNDDSRYALKTLSKKTMADATMYRKGLIDIIMEARFLAILDHPNIVKMRGMTNGAFFTQDFSIILDRLGDTLLLRMTKWRSQVDKTKGVFGGFGGGKQKAQELMLDRILCAWDLASGMAYLHSKKIIYRDLKPENIGFDVRDNVKIFDFGLAKEMKDSDKEKDGNYKMTGYTGSVLYMAPEVMDRSKEQNYYNLTADVYSFGILFWEMMSLATPFKKISTLASLENLVVNKAYRPKVDPTWSKELSVLIQSCWNQRSSARPSFEKVSRKLNSLVSTLNGDSSAEREMNKLDISSRSAMHLLEKS